MTHQMIHPFFAQADLSVLPANFIRNMVILGVAMIVATAFVMGAVFAGLQYFLDKRRAAAASTETQPREISPQPLMIQMVEELHKRFASKEDFENHVARNSERHEQLFEGLRGSVSKKDFNSHVESVKGEILQLREILRVEIPAMERRIAESGEGRVAKLHDRINDVLAEVSALEGKVEEALKR